MQASVDLNITGEIVTAHASGALYWAEQRTLVVADLHLEKGSSFARKQIFLPPYDTSATLRLLNEAMNAYKPERIIALGDSFHDVEGPDRLQEEDRTKLDHLITQVEWIWVSGNHDPVLPDHLGGTCVSDMHIGNLTFRHEPWDEAEPGEVAGHLHPSARVRGRGRSVRKRCFIHNRQRMVMPAFGAFTGGLNVRDRAFECLFPTGNFHAYMLGTDRLYPIAASSCLSG